MSRANDKSILQYALQYLIGKIGYPFLQHNNSVLTSQQQQQQHITTIHHIQVHRTFHHISRCIDMDFQLSLFLPDIYSVTT